MGYDLQFHFDPSENYDEQEMLARLKSAGAQFHKDDHYDDGFSIGFGPFGIWRHTGATKALARGNWLSCRAPPNRLWMIELLRFAERLGCTLHDPQKKIDICMENIDVVLEGRQKFYHMLGGMIGETVKSAGDSGDSST